MKNYKCEIYGVTPIRINMTFRILTNIRYELRKKNFI